MADTIEKQILLRAPIQRVWRALADAREFGTWFGADLAAGAFMPGARVRGPITYEGYEHLSFDVVVDRVEPPHLLSMRWHPSAIDPSVDYESEPTTLITFRLREAESGTLLTVTESGFDAIPEWRRADAYRGNDEGWSEQMRNIERHVARTA
jgi:uncharacterized protein YndB with AHSA1/START domain